VFDRDAIVSCFNHKRAIGEFPRDEDGEPIPIQLIAGLDPAASGYQASFLWGWHSGTERMSKIDSENHLGGGAVEALRIIREWYERYDCRHWVIEDNLYHQGLIQDPRIVEFCTTHGIVIESHQTLMNKHDPYFGVTSMARLFTEGLIDIPHKGVDAQTKAMAYLNQLVNYEGKSTRKSAKSDLVMASWFPIRPIRRWQREMQAAISYTDSQDFAGWEGLFEMEDQPW
jgi:hypothetical protein